MATTPTELRAAFFDFIFGEDSGIICISTQRPGEKGSFKDSFFEWPKQRGDVAAYIDKAAPKNHVWFCSTLLKTEQRKAKYCLPTRFLWADLDTCKPEDIEPQPQIVIETSPERYQALWRLDRHIDAELASDYNKRIAYKYHENGADKSGWDRTQLLRVPYTTNFKYYPDLPEVDLLRAINIDLPVEVFAALEEATLSTEEEELQEGMPDPEILPDPKEPIYKHSANLRRNGFYEAYAYEPEPGETWSGLLWRLLLLCFDAGMSKEEVFSVAIHSNVNKYARDNRPMRHLWRDVLKAERQNRRILALTGDITPLIMPELVDKSELKNLPHTFIDTYTKWASSVTDAVPEYHELSAFILLSSILAQATKLETSYGKLIPNLWGLVLGDSTLTRKTTAMRMAMDMVIEIDKEMILAGDGSAEGILTGLSGRPGQTSIFYKDEVAGFFESVSKKDYLAGLPEIFAQLYDVPEYLPRRLRKETIIVSKPMFIFFGGGIRDKAYSLITEEFITSGFLPRFLIVSGETNLSDLRRTGPATSSSDAGRELIRTALFDLHEKYVRRERAIILGQEAEFNAVNEVYLTTEAWDRYGDIEELMLRRAEESPISNYALPTFERLSRSLLKMTCLLAAARQDPLENTVQASVEDVITAAKYVQAWGRHSVDLIQHSGKGVFQRDVDRVLSAIKRNPGITRGKVMQAWHLSKRQMTEIQETLIDRGEITVQKVGRGYVYNAI